MAWRLLAPRQRLKLSREVNCVRRYKVLFAVLAVVTASGTFAVAGQAAPVAANGKLEIDTGAPGKAIVGNLTVTGAIADGWAGVYPCADGYKGTSNINYRAGIDIANFVVVKADAAGKICVITQQRTHVVFDQTAEVDLSVTNSTRLLDTRTRTKPTAGGTLVVATGTPNRTIIGNLTVDAPEAEGFVSLYPCKVGSSGTSNLNHNAGQTIANAFFAQADSNGDLCIRTTARTHVIIDVAGTMNLSGANSSRLLDTRNGGKRTATNGVVTVATGRPNTSIAGNLTITGSTDAGFASVYPCRAGWQGTSNVNYSDGDIANLFVATADADGNLCVRTSAPTFMVVDTIGQPPFSTHAAARKVDTRTPQPGDVPVVGGCSMFPADNPWNQRIDSLPVRPESSTWVNRLGANKSLAWDFGGPYGFPFVIVPASQPLVPINFTAYGRESDPGPYPIPLNAPIQDGPTSTRDRHVLALQQGTCKLFELYNAFPRNGRWDADSGAVYDLSSNALRPDGWTAADAAGLPMIAGLLRMEDLNDGVVKHAVRFTGSCTQRGYIHPATHQAGQNDNSCPPMGARFRLKASFDTSKFTGQARILLDGLKTYGLIMADNGPDWMVSGANDDRWDMTSFQQLKSVPGSAFEVVDTGPILR
jgi:hypothetical protein